MTSIHSEHFDYILPLGHDALLSRFYKELRMEYAPYGITQVKATLATLKAWVNGVEPKDNGAPSIPQDGRCLLLALSQFDNSSAQFEAPDIDDFAELLESVFADF